MRVTPTGDDHTKQSDVKRNGFCGRATGRYGRRGQEAAGFCKRHARSQCCTVQCTVGGAVTSIRLAMGGVKP